MTVVSERDQVGGDELRKLERIRRAALKSFATRGAAATSLRSVAADAGVSLGLVQHHFETKAGLIKAVDDYVMSVMIAVVAQPVSAPPRDSVADMGSRIATLISEHPEVVDYYGRALVDGSPLGVTIFDTLSAFGTVRWNQRKDNGEVRPEVDLTWATLNSLVLAVGTLILRGHIERQMPNAFGTPESLQRWKDSTTMLLRDGLFVQSADDTNT
jgi:AcrR family transcriptional regulator